MSDPRVSLVCVVGGPIYERYFTQFLNDASELFLPGLTQIVKLPARGGWPYASASRYGVILEHWHEIHGSHIFAADCDMRIMRHVGEEILTDGLTVTTHPGYPPGTPPDSCPYERNPDSRAYVPLGQGERYYPGAFVGGDRASFRRLAEWIDTRVELDHDEGVPAVWYEESYLNRYLVDRPPELVLDKRYCWWEHWGITDEAIIVHLDKTAEEFAARG